MTYSVFKVQKYPQKFMAQPLCRICHAAAPPELIRPCACRGTMSHVHAACAEEWVRRKLADSVAPALAARCEICRTQLHHSIQSPSPFAFLLTWRRWAHLGYMLFVGRRVVGEIRGALRAARAPRKREAASGIAFSMLMAAHYAVFFVVDARHLVLQYRHWRAAAARVRVLDKSTAEQDSVHHLSADDNV